MNELDVSADSRADAARAAREALVGTSIANRYVLRRLIGHGGMGAVYEGEHLGIGKRVADLLKPKWLRIGGYWYPRGGMPIDVFWQRGKLPKGVWVPDQGVAPYRGRR